MAKITVTLDEEQLQEMEGIVLDEDEAEALHFLEVVQRKIEAARKSC